MKHYKICVYAPESILEQLMNRIDRVMNPLYANYDYVFSYYKVKGIWRPLEGANPYDGQINEINKADEIKLEVTVRELDLPEVLKAIRKIHPYETPVIEVYPVQLYSDIMKED